jgi:sugar phosphate isomerase/epimerase
MFPSVERALEYALTEGYEGIDFTIDSTNISSNLISHLEEITAVDHFEIRYHCAANVEIARADKNEADQALKFLKSTLDCLKDLKAGYFTIHLGLNHDNGLSWENAVRNLDELVEYGRSKDILVCVENLKSGWTSEPETLQRLVEATGARVTFDLGHANSSKVSLQGKTTGAEFLISIKDHVVNAHIYEKEEPHHIAPRDLKIIQPQLEALLQSRCDWWVIEHPGEQMVSQTKDLLQLFLSDRN